MTYYSIKRLFTDGIEEVDHHALDATYFYT